MKVELVVGMSPSDRRLLIDGIDVTHACRSVRVNVDTFSAPSIHVELIPEQSFAILDAQVYKVVSGLRTERESQLMCAVEDLLNNHGRFPEEMDMSDSRLKEIKDLLLAAQSAYDRD